MKRREFIASAATVTAAGLLSACGGKPQTPMPPVTVSGADQALGHRLRRTASADFPAVTEHRRTGIVIIGGGIGGLAAAWQLDRRHADDFLLIEMETETGGNSRAGRNAISEYPLGAHYLPLPPPEAQDVRDLLRELGALTGSGDRLAHYDERLLAAAPQERLFIDGWWQEGLWPMHRVPAAEREQYRHFQQHVAALKQAHDKTGQRPFALPLRLSSTAAVWRDLDRVTFRDWLLGAGYTAPGLHWLANYATRDDYGTDYSQTSAWAGLHYFACRSAGELEGHVLTSPGGNTWLARGLGRNLGRRVIAPGIAFRVDETRHGVTCDIFLAAEQRSIRIEARQLIWAAPLFLVPHVFVNPPATAKTLAAGVDYAPWVVVNISLSSAPLTVAGTPLAWDNVRYGSDSLGYVIATHQAMRYAPGPTQLTWYRALHEPASTPSHQRRLLLETPQHWAEAALADLAVPHPEIRELATAIHVQTHGHAMIRPQPGTIWHPARALLRQGSGRVRFAHADVSGMSLFEEALDCGVAAANGLLHRAAVR